MKERGITFIKFSQEEMADLVAFLYFINYFDKIGDKENGEKLFVQKRCVACHSLWGKGGSVGPDLASAPELISPADIATQMWNHVPNMEKATRERKIPWPRFEPGQMRDILEYISSQKEK